MLKPRIVTSAFVASAILAACSSVDPTDSSRNSQSIFGGAPDTTHPAVMALINQTGGACSGTTIAVNGQFGYLLTAAHCLVAVDGGGNVITPIQPVMESDLLVVPGTDYSSSLPASTFHPVQEYVIHPGYNGNVSNPNDIAVVRYIGADGSTPTIPHLTAAQDDLANGINLLFVGYGQTETNSMNSIRNAVTKTIVNLSASQVTHSRANGTGTCRGDSGGPGIRTTAMGERVASVTSFSSGASCASGFGVSVRTSNHEAFIDTFLAATPPAVDCTLCRTAASTSFGPCTAENAACAPGTACDRFLTCANACAMNDQACVQACATAEPQGQADLATVVQCTCDDCPTECTGVAACTAPACGLEFSDTTCNTCNEAQCCNETTACADDADCRNCATSMMPPATCATNALYQAFRVCGIDNCGTQCGAAACGFNNPDACGDCIDNQCCSQGNACARDGQCFQCATGSGSQQACSGNQLFSDLFDCLGTCAGNPCMVADPGAGGAGGMGMAGSAGAGAGTGTGAQPGAGGLPGAGGSGAGINMGQAGATPITGSDPESTGGCTVAASRTTSSGHWLMFAFGAGLAAARRRRFS